jgi:hypothetical protein
MGKRLVAERSRGSSDHDGVARVTVKLLKVDRFDFEKIKYKNFKKRVELRLRVACGGCNLTIHGGGEA